MSRYPGPLKLNARCPNVDCDMPSKQDVYPAARAVYARMAPERVVGRVQCWNCRKWYLLTASAWQDATEKAGERERAA